MKHAVLLLVFNRPETTGRVFEAIRAARPLRLYIAADGPRPGRPGEAERCAETRRIVSLVDWPCEVRTLFRDANLGCKRAVASAIDWFFGLEESGIILEDDVWPLPSFFEYCDQMLDHYRDDPRVAAISGCNLVANRFSADASYFFSRYCHVWGWATWRRAWARYDRDMARWPEWDRAGGLDALFDDPDTARFWRSNFNRVHAGKLDTWDFQWLFACWASGALCAIPAFNQTLNLGFDADATHTRQELPEYVRDSTPSPLSFPLRHVERVERCVRADAIIDRVLFGQTWYSRQKRKLFELVARLRAHEPGAPGTRA